MIKLILFTILSFSAFPLGEIQSTEVTKLYIEADKSIGTNRHWSIPVDENKGGNLNLFLETRTMFKIYSRSKVDSFWTANQFRYISLMQEFAYNIKDGIEIYIQHKSEHSLDKRFDYGVDYPNRNSIGFRFHFINKE